MGSSEMLKQAKEQAKIRYLLMSLPATPKGLKETIVGASRKEPLAMNSDGEIKTYQRANRRNPSAKLNPNGQQGTDGQQRSVQ